MIRKPDMPRENLIKLNVFQRQSLLLFGISYFVESTGNICDIINHYNYTSLFYQL